MEEASRPFVEKVTEYVQTNPQLISPFNKVDEMQKDRTLINQLAPLNMDDTLMEADAEVLDQANIFYASVQ